MEWNIDFTNARAANVQVKETFYRDLVKLEDDGTMSLRPGISMEKVMEFQTMVAEMTETYKKSEDKIKKMHSANQALQKKSRQLKADVQNSKYCKGYMKNPLIAAILNMGG